MNNDFSTESLLGGQGIYAVAKGDVEGHEFHGNQYESDGGTGTKTETDATAAPKAPAAPAGPRPIHEIASDIEREWGKQGKGVNYAARPYLDAMHSLEKPTDNYYADSGKSVISYFLANASQFKGEAAKGLKNELKAAIK